MGDIIRLPTPATPEPSHRRRRGTAPVPISSLREASETRARAALDLDAAYVAGNSELSTMVTRLGIDPGEFEAATRRFPAASPRAVRRARAQRASACLEDDWRLPGHQSI